jgi:hypothetical protein
MRKTIDQSKAVSPALREGSEPVGFSFAAPQVIAGITFHLLDEGIATSVCAESAARVVRRMTAAGAPRVEISRSLWQEMSNPERLAWLLATSEASYHVAKDGTARLSARGG